MRCSFSALIVATLTIGQVAASPFEHDHGHLHAARFHAKANVLPIEVVDQTLRRPIVSQRRVGRRDVKCKQRPTSVAASAVASTEVASPSSSVAAAVTPPAAAPPAGSPSSSTPSTPANSTPNTPSDVLPTLTKLGIKGPGVNAVSNNGGVWIGSGGEYMVDVTNDSGENIIFVSWGAAASWVNVQAPLITQSLAPGQSFTISMASGQSGAMSAIYSDTKLVNGQISNTWLEYTTGQFGVFDVSREVNMNGHPISSSTDGCNSNMNTCVFKCTSGTTCMTGYELDNCATGSQKGASFGMFQGAPSGGCMIGSTKKISVTFS